MANLNTAMALAFRAAGVKLKSGSGKKRWPRTRRGSCTRQDMKTGEVVSVR